MGPHSPRFVAPMAGDVDDLGVAYDEFAQLRAFPEAMVPTERGQRSRSGATPARHWPAPPGCGRLAEHSCDSNDKQPRAHQRRAIRKMREPSLPPEMGGCFDRAIGQFQAACHPTRDL